MMQRLMLGFLLTLSLTAHATTDLLEIYKLALANDPQIRAALAQQNATYELRPQALAALRPNLSASGTLAYQKQDVESLATGYSDHYASNSLTLSLTQPIYRRDLFIALDQTDDQVAQADAQYASAEQSLMLRTAQAYFGILSAQDDVSFAVSEKQAIERQLEQARERFEVGLIATTDVHEVQARYDQADANQLSAENALDNAGESLREIIQSTPGKLANLPGEMTLQSPQPANIDAWSQDAQNNNPSLLAARLAMQIANWNIDAQKASDYPTLGLTASLGKTNTNSDNPNIGSDAETQSLSLALSVPIYQGGGVNARIRQARYQFDAAREQLDQQSRAVDRQVRNAYRGIQTSISRVNALSTAQASAQSALEATEAGFDAGTRTLVDVLNGQRDLYRARRDYAQSRYDYVLNTLSLLQAVGTLSEADLHQVNGWLE